MPIMTDPPEWEVPGPKPPQSITHDLGWEVGSYPPAPWFNWFFYVVSKSLKELEAAILARVINESGVPGIQAGREAERPEASLETAGRIFIATDTKRIFRDRGNGWDLLSTPEAIGAETPEGAQAKADAAASAALSAARAYADTAASAAETAAKSYADNVVAAHANRTDNPHGVTKAQVGLGNVENYGVATQAEAEAGTANNKYMTPLRTKQAIDAIAGQYVMVAVGEAWDGATLPVFPGYSRHYYIASFDPDWYEPFMGFRCAVDQSTRKLTSLVRTHSSGQHTWASRRSWYLVVALK